MLRLDGCLNPDWLDEIATSGGGIFVIAGITGSAKSSTSKDCVEYLHTRGCAGVEISGRDSLYVRQAAEIAASGVPVLLSITIDAPDKVREKFEEYGRLEDFSQVRAVLYQRLEKEPSGRIHRVMTWTRVAPAH